MASIRCLMKNVMFLLALGLVLSIPATAAAQTGQIKGRVLEFGSGDPLSSAAVKVEETSSGAVSDEHGNFSISRLPVGSYTLTVNFIGYQTTRADVTVEQGRTATVEIQLKGQAVEMEALTVHGEMSLGQARAFQEQKLSPNIVNVVDEEQFDRFPDRNAAETVQRIPGISIDRDQGEGELVQIRGLTPDLNSLTLNGQRIPSPDPDDGQRSVGLDLLNSDLIERITVTKALTPDMDGDALGGVVDFKFKGAPEKTNLSLNVAGGFNNQASEFEEYGKELASVNGYAGGRFADGKLGMLIAGTYYRTNRGSLLQELTYTDDTGTIIEENHTNDYDVKRQRYGVNLNTDYRFDELNSIFLNFSYNFYKDDEIRRTADYLPFSDREERQVRNRLEDQQLGTVQFGGEHFLSNAILDYTATWIKSLEDMPDRTYYRWRRDNYELAGMTNDQIFALDGSDSFGSGEDPLTLDRIRYDDRLKEDSDISGMMNLTLPFNTGGRQSSFKFGGKYLYKSVSNDVHRFNVPDFPVDHTLADGSFGFIDQRWDDINLSSLGLPAFEEDRDEYLEASYDANETVGSAYGMGTFSLSPKWTLLTGVRMEHTSNDYNHVSSTIKGEGSYSTWLPSAHLTYQIDDNANLRFAVSTGLARPRYDQIAPYEFSDEDDRTISRGNPDLKASYGKNFDVLFERYSGALGMFTAGFFYKKIDDLLTSTKYNQDIAGENWEISQPINGGEAEVWGLELALQKRFYAWNLPGQLRWMGIMANYTYAHSEGEVNGRTLPLRRSPEHNWNLGLTYDNPNNGLSCALTTVFRDDILIGVGSNERTDHFYDSETHLDFSAQQKLNKQWSLFLQLNNLTDQDEVETFGDPDESFSRLNQRVRYGTFGSLGIRFNYY